MLEQIKNIIIKGGPFTAETTFELFPQRLNLLYGRNGSGKSTIAKCIRKLGKEDDGSGYSAETNPSLSTEQAQHIFVFDEDFVSSNFRMNKTGLSSIVMLGKQVGLDEQLKVLQQEKKEQTKTKEDCVKKLEILDDKKEPSSPLYHLNKIKKKLSADGGWAEKDKMIKGNSIKSQVTDVLVSELMALKQTTHYSDLLKLFDEKFKTLRNIKKGGRKLDVISSNVLFENINNLEAMMSRLVNEPHLDSRDKAIIELVKTEYGAYLNQVHPVFDNPQMKVCPLCLRPIDKYDKEELFSKIQQFFNKDVEEYKQELQAIIERLQQWKQVEIGDLVQEIVGQETFDIFRKYELEMQKVYSELQAAFVERKKNVFGISTYFKWFDVNNAQKDYLVMLGKINAAINHYNREVEQEKELVNELIRINRIIAARELRDDFVKYRKQLTEKSNCLNELKEIEEKLQHTDAEIAEILSKKAQVLIALDFINEALAYIFFSDKRLVLENISGQYRLKSNGKDVKPGDVSTGERNAIALCYFFAKIFEHHENENRYKDEMLVVLDDPITSFDKDNKVGMMTFLRWQVSEIYNGCNTSKMLIMSHDLMTVFDIHKIFQDIINAKSQSSVFELKNKVLGTPKAFNELKSEYKKLIDDVFSLANGLSSDFIGIGNKMRRIEEAYSTFVCNRGFISLLHDDDFLQKVPPSKRRFYQNFMSRLVLNSESHTEEKSYSLESFVSLFSEEEIRKTAKYLLMLFYYVDEFHLKSYLGDNFEVVKAWIDEEF